MRCCVPFSRNTPDNVLPLGGIGRGISFHGFPSDASLRATWLRALGLKGAPLPDPAVVCSQHFLDDDINETESDSRQIDVGAIPSTVQVCMMCLDTDGKMFLMSKRKLEKAYEYLTGYAPCNQGNLKQTLCVQCAQRLMNFSRFRDQSLRARALMMDLVEKHELITRLHIKMINRTKHRLRSPLVVTNLGADFCDLHIQEDKSDDNQIESETTIDTGVVKIEESDDPMVIKEDMDVIYGEDDYADNVNNDFVDLHEENISNLLKFESADFKCWLCSEEFVQEHAYREHMIMHAQSGSGAGESGTTAACERRAAGPSLPSLAEISPDTAGPLHRPDTAGLHDGRARADVAHTSVAPASSSVAISKDSEKHLTEEDITRTVQSATVEGQVDLSISSPSKTDCLNDDVTRQFIYSSDRSRIEEIMYVCDFCPMLFQRKSLLVKHIRNHVTVNFTCEICQYQCNYKYRLMWHMKTHAGVKSFSCKICEYQSAHKSDLVVHMRMHTDDVEFYPCSICGYKANSNCGLVTHMRAHTGEKPFSCELCEYTTAYKSCLVEHMRKHTGDKPYSCTLCEFKCKRKSHLTAHFNTHW